MNTVMRNACCILHGGTHSFCCSGSKQKSSEHVFWTCQQGHTTTFTVWIKTLSISLFQQGHSQHNSFTGSIKATANLIVSVRAHCFPPTFSQGILLSSYVQSGHTAILIVSVRAYCLPPTFSQGILLSSYIQSGHTAFLLHSVRAYCYLHSFSQGTLLSS